MESQHQKWVNLSFALAAMLLGYVCYSAGMKAVSLWELEAKIRSVTLWVPVLSSLIGVLGFLILSRNDEATQFMSEVVVEVSRVTWPTTDATVKATGIVVAMVIVSSILLGLLDRFWTAVIRWVL